MADGLCTEGTLRSKMCLEDAFGDSKNNCVSVDLKKCESIDNCEKLSLCSSKVTNNSSFYIDSDSGQLLCSKFHSDNSVSVGCTNIQPENSTVKCLSHGSDAVENPSTQSSSVCDSPCSSADHEDCRKKRCADRYDSSESSDSGVAQLSCTDCSACSSSSTASSDITDPGSPFSTGSSHGEDSTHAPTSQLTPPPLVATMPPQHSTSPPPDMTPSPAKQPWPWDKAGSLQNSLKQPSSRTSPSLKRITDHKNGFRNTLAKRQKTKIQQLDNADTSNCEGNTLTTVCNDRTTPSLCHILPKPSSEPTVSIHSDSNTSAITTSASPFTRVIDRLLPKERAKVFVSKLKTLPPNNELTTSGVQQVKITEYFKAQIKPPAITALKKDSLGLKNDLKRQVDVHAKSNNNKAECMENGNDNLQKYLGMLSDNLGQQLYFNRNCDNINTAEFYRKINVRTLTFRNNLNSVGMDTKINGKMRPVVSLTRKILPKAPTEIKSPTPQPKMPTATVKLTALRIPNDSNSTAPKPTKLAVETTSSANKLTALGTHHTAKKKANPTASKATVVNAINLNTALPTVMTPKVNSVQVVTSPTIINCPPLKLHGSFLPIVKLNTVPGKLIAPTVKTSSTATKADQKASHFYDTSLSIETGVTTVHTRKSKLVSPSSELSTVSAKSPCTQTLFASPKSTILEAIQQERSKLNISATTPSDCPSSHLIETASDALSVVKTETKGNLLQVSVTHKGSHLNESQKSPILSQPKTIRFPPRQQDTSREDRRSDSRESGLCQWLDCETKFETSGALLDHLQINHVIPQEKKENYVCLWIGCKVHGRTSCSRSWLERHVTSHAGNKPYPCIVEGCGCRFSSQTTLQRHVNGHFNGEALTNNNQRRSVENSSNKQLRRNGKKIRYRLQPWSARMFDYFDGGIMEGLQHRLVNMTQVRTAGKIVGSGGNTVTLRSRVMARRVEPSGLKQILVRWYPENVIPDEWVLESEAVPMKSVPIPGLEPSSINVLHTTLMKRDTSSQKTTGRSTNRRKRVCTAQPKFLPDSST